MDIVAKGQQRATNWNIPNLLTQRSDFFHPSDRGLINLPRAIAQFFGRSGLHHRRHHRSPGRVFCRLQKGETAVGKLLDPMADKLLIISGMIMLIPLDRIPAWMVVLMIGREVASTGLRGIASAEGVVVAASRWGKGKMVFQSMALGALMLHYRYLGIDFHILGTILLWDRTGPHPLVGDRLLLEILSGDDE